ncbi:MAG: hypothetical protein ACTHMJ_21615, partial [Thermomicrobiales bacterium]
MLHPDDAHLITYYRRFRARQENLATLKSECADPALGDQQALVLYGAIGERMNARAAMLLAEFGVDIHQEPPKQWPWARDPATPADWIRLARLVGAYWVDRLVVARFVAEVLPLPAASRWPAASQVTLWGAYELHPRITALIAALTPAQEVQGEASCALTGLVGVTARRYPDLAALLAAEAAL